MSKQYKIEGRPSTIFRTVHDKENPYVVINRTAILNPDLSFKAKGILAYLMSRPDGWETNYVDLANRSTDGIISVRSGIKELRDAGHISQRMQREKSGRFDKTLWEVYETPHICHPHAVDRLQVLNKEVRPPPPEITGVEVPPAGGERAHLPAGGGQGFPLRAGQT